MQISELRLYDVHERVITESRSRFVCGSSRAVRGEEPSRAVDGKVSVKNKWCDRSPQFGEVSNLWLRLDFPRPQEVMYYAWWTADDRGGAGHQRDPVSWRMQGSDNGIDWTDLDVRTDYDVPTNRCFRVGPFGCPHPAIDNLGAVDPFMGTGPDLHDRPGDCGMSHPGARVPFGMTQILADLPRRDSSNYMFTDPRTEGISCMRLNGVGYYGDLGTFLVRPTVDCRDTFASRAISDFTHESETAEPGYYATFLKRFGVYAEVTATKRGAMMRLTYPATDKADLCIDLARRIGLKSSWSRESRQTARVVGDDRLEGEMFYSMKDGGWGRGEGKCQYRLFFLCEFSKPLTDVLF